MVGVMLNIIINLSNFLKESAEKLYIRDNIYDIIVVINYNLTPVRKRKCNFFT